jgi:LytS/YehU family sensor histidine kinase
LDYVESSLQAYFSLTYFSLTSFSMDRAGLYFHLLWIALTIGSLAAIYFTVWENAQLSAVRVQAAELERQGIERQVVESRLNVMKARVEPEFLFRSIAHIQQLYRHDKESAERHLEDLIAYLRAALPQMRGGASTLGDELHLASTYLQLHEELFAGRLYWDWVVEAGLDEVHFPPMTLLPLIDDALRRASSTPQPRLFVQVRASSDHGRLAVVVEDDCGVARPGSTTEALLAQQRSFAEFFGGDASVRHHTLSNNKTRIILEADIGQRARDHR